jgi:hypothetical protein
MTGRKWLLYFAVVGTVSAGPGKDERKRNKDKTPPQRLRRLIKFSNEWLNINIRDAEGSASTNEFRSKLHGRIQDNIQRRTDRMLKVFNAVNDDGEQRCGFFDPTTTYGGPQLNAPDLNDEKKEARREYLENQRNRRHNIIDEFKWVSLTPQDWHHIRRDEDLDHIEDKIMELEKWFQDNLDDKDSLTFDILDGDFDDDETRHRRGAVKTNLDQGKFGTADARYNKNDPITGWKQICTGFRKWAERYIAYCRAEYVSKSFSKWATEKLWRKTEQKYRCKILGQERDDC